MSSRTRAQFSEDESVRLTIATVAINGANRINGAFRTTPGSRRPKVRAAVEEKDFLLVAIQKSD